MEAGDGDLLSVLRDAGRHRRHRGLTVMEQARKPSRHWYSKPLEWVVIAAWFARCLWLGICQRLRGDC